MKAAFLLATVLVFASSTSALYHFRATASEELVDVGNLDIYAAVWQHFQDSSDGFTILSDKEYRTVPSTSCLARGDKDTYLTVNVRIEGKWGNEGELGHDDMGKSLLDAMWAYVQHAQAGSTHDIFTNCPPWTPLVPISGRPRTDKEATCGMSSAYGVCPCVKPGTIGAAKVNCYDKIAGYGFPSKLSIALYDEDDKLMADELAVSFSAGKHRPGGCGVGPVDDYLRGTLAFIPILGQFIDRGILMACAH